MLPLDAVIEPFKKLILQAGLVIDQNNHKNVISTDIYIRKTTVANNVTVYAVIMSFHYREMCTVSRLKVNTSCALWEHYEPLKFFDDPDELKTYVAVTISTWAKYFAENLHH